MISTVTYILTGLLMTICALVYRQSKPKRIPNLPPGPKPWPILGSLFEFIGRDLFQSLDDLCQRFGSLVWLKMGTENMLIVNHIDPTVEAFVRQSNTYSGRPAKLKTVDIMLGDGHDIVMNNSDHDLRYYRRIVHSYLAQHSQTRHDLHQRLSEEAASLVVDFRKFSDSGEEFDPKLHILRVVSNVLCETILNHRFESINDELREQLDIVQNIVDNLESFNIVDVLPFLAHFPVPSLVRFKKSLARKDTWITRIIKEHRETLGPTDRDLLDVLLRRQKEIRDSGEDQLTDLSDLTIGHIVYELFGGGIESSTLVVLWFLVYMIHNPKWQTKVANEVREVSKQRGGIFPTDKAMYPILDSSIKETMRLSTILPIGFPHRTVKDSKLSGYDIPKDTMVFTNIWAVHHDPNIWEDPYTFNPERFLKDGETVHKRGYLPFGVGGRVCLGSTLAKLEAFMFTSHIIANFEVGVSKTSPLPATQGPAGLAHRTLPFSITLKARDL